MFQTLYSSGPNGLWIFLLLSVAIIGGAAFVSGKAIAETWRPFWQVIAYGLLLALVARFLHFALFEEVLFSAKNYVVDAVVSLAAGILGYMLARKRQMAANYTWPRT